jgi:hypothetical protein
MFSSKRFLLRALRFFALAMMAVAAVFGIPVILDPPPRNQIVQVDRKGGRPRRGGRRS